MALALPAYRPRDPVRGVLHTVVRTHLETFLREAAHRADGVRLPVIRTLLDFYRRKARQHGVGNGHTGALTVIQRFGGGLNLNIHFHTLALDGVFSEDATGGLHFHPAPAPSDDAVARLLATIRRRVLRLLRRRGLASDEDLCPPGPVAEESPALAGISSASVVGRIALGRRAGARVWRLGDDPEAAWVASTGPRQAHLEGFDLHANAWVPSTNRARLEELCRYLLRPPVAQDRLRLTGDGRIRLRLKTPWADGTRHLLFEPVEASRAGGPPPLGLGAADGARLRGRCAGLPALRGAPAPPGDGRGLTGHPGHSPVARASRRGAAARSASPAPGAGGTSRGRSLLTLSTAHSGRGGADDRPDPPTPRLRQRCT